jgi:hypothetical protein
MFVKRKKNINRFDLQECRDFTWRVSDCEELSGGYSQEMSGSVMHFQQFYQMRIIRITL